MYPAQLQQGVEGGHTALNLPFPIGLQRLDLGRKQFIMALSLIASGYGREPLVHQPGIVHPEGIARTAHIGTTVARRELQDEVSGRFGR